ncbi:hypothetical protein GZH47_20440 [Paenibacillus rhizovicinus]|uniref:Uncharacterized protein n=1 Tax=Paenibacillus rhizovicinus TaxID=2704463 RepID=A0A6C0P371_9BACL|nr:hypothetical protein [Paenibacillus rhizovicinus]QHW32929.1 hypothetical protein GZH47_20440 [Paenibacillus rhizovicinus]
MIEVMTIEDFTTYKSQQGYFIIADSTGRKLHSTRCAAVDSSSFKDKAGDAASHSRRCFYTDDFFEAREYPKVKKCEECRRLL